MIFNKPTVADVVQGFQKTIKTLEDIADNEAIKVQELNEEKVELASKITQASKEKEVAEKVANNIKKLIEA